VAFTSNHFVYNRVHRLLFCRPAVITGLVSAKPLAHDVGTSVAPVREALLRLAQQDIIDAVPSKGFFLPRLNSINIQNCFRACRAIVRTMPAYGSAKLNQDDGFQARALDSDIATTLNTNKAIASSASPRSMASFKEERVACLDKALFTMMRTILDEESYNMVAFSLEKVVAFRYHVYINIEPASIPEISHVLNDADAINGSDCLNKAQERICMMLDQYAELTPEICQTANANCRRSPYM